MKTTFCIGRGLTALVLVLTLLTSFGGTLPVAATSITPRDATYQALPFSQNWTNTTLITANDDWSGVSGIVGYLGNYDAATPINVDPQTLLADYATTDIDVIANQTTPNTLTTGGVAEFHITDPVVALQGSGTADAPFILVHINTIGYQNISVAYNVRDVDGAADNAAQQVALHYRVGTSGNFTNVPAAYISDATTGPSLATLVTPINVTLPAVVDNASQVQLRIMTTNAVGSDEWVGIDDISITGTPIATTPAIALSKTVGTDPTTCAVTDTITLPAGGGEVTYCYEVENTGDVTLNLHDLDDSELGNIFTSFSYGLAPGASAFITQTAFINETTVNSATWTAYNPNYMDLVHATDVATVTVEAAAPAIALNKTVGTDPLTCATTDAITLPAGGGEVTYCYTVENTGNVTLNEHDLNDSELGVLLLHYPYALAPGASVFLTETAVIDVTTVNSATWTAYNPDYMDLVHATDVATVTVEAAAPAIALNKTVGTDPLTCATTDAITLPAGGGEVTYCYEVENTGNVTLNLHDLDDSELGNIFTSLSHGLAPGASAFITQTAFINETTVNSAIWTAYNPDYMDLVHATDVATVTVALSDPSIVLTKTVGIVPGVCATTDDITVPEGTTVYYCYTVTNTGDVTLNLHGLVDDPLGTLFSGLNYALTPGSSINTVAAGLSIPVVINVTTVNTATWTAYNANGPSVQATDTARVTVEPSAVSVSRLRASAAGGWSSIALLGAFALGGFTWRRKRR